MNQLLKSSSVWNWSPDCQQAFTQAKKVLSSPTAGLEEGIWDWSGKTKVEEYIDSRPVAKFPWVNSFEENVDIILQPIKVQEQLKSLYGVCIAHIHEGIQ